MEGFVLDLDQRQGPLIFFSPYGRVLQPLLESLYESERILILILLSYFGMDVIDIQKACVLQS